MPQHVNDIMQLVLRWAHVVAGILWIGHLYFFNFVNAHVAKALDGPTKKVVVPELMPRALYWFRWGALWTWLTGILLGGLV
ncbi:MAG TPA: urate hydroxylase PuuD, partial [Thermoanaerobaculia bacterium]|nr:urate hydroxylase PuuD [Thermoanaerobaculia bacterium]